MATTGLQATIRSMTDDDLVAADRVWMEAFATSTEFPPSPTPRTTDEVTAALERRAHLLLHDPAGSFVATIDDKVVGIAQSLLREGTFVLAMLAVTPGFQDLRIGEQLLTSALDYAKSAHAAYIYSSSDPRAIHRYLRAGFRLRPAIRITPKGMETTPRSSRLRISAGTMKDIAFVSEIDRAVRGSARSADVAYWLRAGATLVIHDDGGYAVLTPARLTALAATEEAIARELFGAVLEGFPDGVARPAGFIVGEQHWAIEEASSRRASIEVHGAVMTRGVERPPYPYLPNGLFG
jgi:predicted N-acetyltransferase YhbS